MNERRAMLQPAGTGRPVGVEGFTDFTDFTDFTVLADLTDDSLVIRAMRGSRDAFGELARRYRPLAVRTAASIIGPDRAEDVVQDALLLAYRALGMLKDPRRFPQWLGTITRYRALRLGRSEGRRAAGQVDLDAFHGELPERSDDDREHDTSDAARLDAALLRIPAPFARVLRLHFLARLPHQVIAERLGVSLSTSKWRCFRGKQLLRAVLLATDPLTRHVERTCARCRIHTDGAGCEETFDESRRDRELPRAPAVRGTARRRRKACAGPGPTFHDAATPDT